eukprot:TRINITY_DN45639_c0_g1_i1.p1 TRINITY_DN45639_c0_g1~~TRINITY_DN45639_c0_g1_i1.p1  ORF type:complete len:258 (+),score=39.70 TRINITY_DN45639_c0_g1_i1:196-969(+)
MDNGVSPRGACSAAGCPRCYSADDRDRKLEVDTDGDVCIFCHSANGVQYVPLHFEGCSKTPATVDQDTSVLPWADSLRAHCACKGCWAAWEAQQLVQGLACLCPVCQRRVDLRKCYEEDLCIACAETVVLASPPLSKQLRFRKRTGVLCVTFVIAFLAVAVWTFVHEVLLREAEDAIMHFIDGSSSDPQPIKLPEPLRETVCPLLAAAEDFGLGHGDVFVGTILRLVKKWCHAGAVFPTFPEKEASGERHSSERLEL